MKILNYILISVLVFLAISSGITKLMLMPQDVEFFGKFGFSNSILMVFGAVQAMGGILLIPPKLRIIGAALIAMTFLISAVLLFMNGNILVSGITMLFVLLLILVIHLTLKISK